MSENFDKLPDADKWLQYHRQEDGTIKSYVSEECHNAVISDLVTFYEQASENQYNYFLNQISAYLSDKFDTRINCTQEQFDAIISGKEVEEEQNFQLEAMNFRC